MNYVEKMEQEARLKSNISDWMEAHGKVLSDRQRSLPERSRSQRLQRGTEGQKGIR